jgi:hypothetical protein
MGCFVETTYGVEIERGGCWTVIVDNVLFESIAHQLYEHIVCVDRLLHVRVTVVSDTRIGTIYEHCG